MMTGGEQDVTTLIMHALTIEQWKALAFIIIITSAITETAKRVFFIYMPKTRKLRFIAGTSFVVGCAAAFCGFMMVGTQWTPDYYWAMFGVVAGPASNFMHYISLSVIAWKFPSLAASIKGKKIA